MAYMPKLQLDNELPHVVTLTLPSTLRYTSKEGFKFLCDCATDLEAELLRDRLEAEFYAHIEKVRRYEYERGWADAKAHKAKSLPRTCTLWLPEKT